MVPLLEKLRLWSKGEGGAAAVELALVLSLLTIPLLNVVDLAFYAYQNMQAQSAAQMGAQAAFSDCNLPKYLPALSNCTASNSANSMTVTTAVTAAVQGTTLGTGVSLSNLTEGYYCATTTNTLVAVDSETLTCGGVTNAADPSSAPGDYLIVNVAFTYQPIFSSVSVASLLNNNITATSYVRLS